MKFADDIKNKKVLVLGLAKTGMSVARHLTQLGALVTVNDQAPLEENPQAQSLIEENIRVVSGGHPVSLLEEDFVLIVKNPGIPYSNPLIQAAMAKGLSVITDIECAYRLTAGEIIGITGSNGKTTTSQLTYNILSQAKQDKGNVYLAGNIGVPSLDVAMTAETNDRIVLELSSFQLQGSQDFRPHIAAITNIYPSHLDYHGSLAAYKAAKWRITANQEAEDYLILNADQEQWSGESYHTKAAIIPFSLEQKLDQGAWYNRQEKALMWQDEKVADRELFPLPGNHNVANALVAVAIAKLYAVDNASIQKALANFYGVSHRLQFVQDYQGRAFFNDSKATNNEATITALKSFTSPVIWLAGGLDRGNSVEALAPYLKHVKGMIVFGESKEKLIDLAEKLAIPVFGQAEEMTHIVDLAYAHSQEGDTILLSPANASWDQYNSFEERGDCFIQAVQELIHK
ncbi:UDP-N-acetylmuramoyl-L-alanine--D-glutamate ligase [Aerococcus kribbianus]|uniref:UDP-N-acetylmuramoylalanine--D-glutamate ligase n=1 Tax=Aerococcus kribbianus TaxID=2999064 RepID=A0A9X3JG55_9LACT|nr:MULTISPECIES: UDP-N-acetylmuramoyl-L-alanine--D-glutamate ligase [unclassified Aerococcus]MCZ0717712.1 UDP-N-acetylmuramoyl-L-alanine--D-glutamate ligase [Aerococcus sp. YH-aer221]MCZ0726000.1 UDP-N-acetylmuramoyl-L-alanine--D-glutamate ligase [Aerococcus sp. YH-aer222]